MAKVKTAFVCMECGTSQSRWLGRCPDCGAWDTLKEEKQRREKRGSGAVSSLVRPGKAVPIQEVELNADERIETGIGELDRVLGGGLVPGCTLLFAGEPGIGKSTLLLQCAQELSKERASNDSSADAVSRPEAQTEAQTAPRKFLYVTGEESAAQIRLRADRIGDSGDQLYVLAECDLEVIEEQIIDLKPAVVGIDSIQTLRWQEIPSAAGGSLQVREVTARLMNLARSFGIPTLLVGHVTKEGNIAGPRMLEHMVDCVLSFEGERTQGLRVLRGIKNRFGSTQEVGLFDMQGGGLREIANPSQLLLGDRRSPAPGAATAAIVEGSRPLLVEIQALVSPTSHGTPARKVSGFDSGRLSMLAAVLEKRLGIPLGDRDIYVNVVGGVRISTTCADLALAAAILSSLHERPLSHQRVFMGEVGLLGEVRRVGGIRRRLEEAHRLGFTHACTPVATSDEEKHSELDTLEISDLGTLAELLVDKRRR